MAAAKFIINQVNAVILRIKEHVFAQPNFSFVTPRLAIGGETRNLSLYHTLGVTCILNVASEERFSPEGLAKLGIKLCSLPVADSQPPQLDQLRWAVNWIDSQLTNGDIVCVQCKNGVGRSVVVVAAYLISKGADYSGAINSVRSVWSRASPNPAQIAAIKKFENHLNTES
jgi:diacylglycerol kinase (ATP)